MSLGDALRLYDRPITRVENFHYFPPAPTRSATPVWRSPPAPTTWCWCSAPRS
ncbi:MAG: hypothetical protein U0802_14520 [Candidatus Binatia bacterium]